MAKSTKTSKAKPAAKSKAAKKAPSTKAAAKKKPAATKASKGKTPAAKKVAKKKAAAKKVAKKKAAAKKATKKPTAKKKPAKQEPTAKLFRFEEEATPRVRYGGERINAWPCYGRAPSRSSAMREALAPPLETRWTLRLNAPACASPAVGQDGLLYVPDREGGLYAFELESGEGRYALRTDPVREASPAWPLVAQGLVPRDRVPVSSTPAVAHHHLLYGDAEGIFYCVRKSGGEVLWRKASPLSMAGRGGVAYPAPLIFDDHVFAADADGNVYAAATRNGRAAFRTSIRGRPTAPLALSPPRALLLVACDPLFPGEPRLLHGLDAWEGQALWKLELPGRAHAVACGRDVALCLTDGGLTVAYLDDGALAWSLPEPTGTALCLAGPRAFVGGAQGVTALDLPTQTVRWAQPELGAVHGLALADRVLWIHAEGGLAALDADTGKVLAKPRLPGTPVGQPVFAGGLLIVATDAGELRALGPRG